MSAAYPEWYELPEERWQERTLQEVRVWNPERYEYWYEMQKHRSWRDSQRQHLYNAEAVAHYSFEKAHPGVLRTFTSIEDIREYVEQVLTSPWIIKRFGKQEIPDVTCREEKCATCSTWKKVLNFPKRYWDQMDVLHEISHWVHPCHHGTSHGRFFARTMMELCGQEIHPEFRKHLKEAYKRRHVKFSPFPAYSEEVLAKKKELGRRLAERRANV